MKPGSKLTVHTSLPATLVGAYLVLPDRDRAQVVLAPWPNTTGNVSGSDVWRFRLPRGAPRAAAVDVFGYFAQGDLDTWTGVKTDGCRSGDLEKY